MKQIRIVTLLLVLAFLVVACGGDDAETPAENTNTTTESEDTSTETDEPADEPADEAMGDALFVSTQFSPVEEQDKFRAILEEGGYDFSASEEGPLIDQVLAGSGSVDVVGALHGTFPPLARGDAMSNMADIADDLSGDRDLAQAFIDTGLLGSDDFLYYVPWMQATYIMAAHTDALQYSARWG